MTVAEYAKDKGVSKQSVYDRLRRGTLSYEVIDGVKHIVVTSNKQGAVETTLIPIDNKIKKKLEKALKKLNKVKHKLELAVNEIQGLHKLVSAGHSEIDSLKKSLGLLGIVINKNAQLPPPEEIIVKSKKDKRKNKRDKKKSKK